MRLDSSALIAHSFDLAWSTLSPAQQTVIDREFVRQRIVHALHFHDTAQAISAAAIDGLNDEVRQRKHHEHKAAA